MSDIQRSGSNSGSDSDEQGADPRKLFVGGIPYDAVAQDLLDYFERYGPIREAVVIRDKSNPLQNQGYGFVIFEDPKVAQWVLSTEKNPIIKGRKANVQKGHKRTGLSSTNFQLQPNEASLLQSLYYTEPLGVMEPREVPGAALLPLGWPSFPAGFPSYNAQLQWTHPLLVQQQQQQHAAQQTQQQQQAQAQAQANAVLLSSGLLLPSTPAFAPAALSASSQWPGAAAATAAFGGFGAYLPGVTAPALLGHQAALYAASEASAQPLMALMASGHSSPLEASPAVAAAAAAVAPREQTNGVM